jgi:hypothetical protein
MIAQISKSELPPRIDALARDFLLSETHEEDITRHSDEAGSSFEAPSEWAGEHGERYRPVLLAHPTDEGLAIMALAVMVIQPGVPFVYPAEIAAEVSRFVHDSGDVSVLLTSG